MIRLGLLFLFIIGHLFCSISLSQEVRYLDSNSSLEQLPEPSSKAQKIVLYRKNISSFRSLLLAPVASWIEADLIRARLFKNLDFSWDYQFQSVINSKDPKSHADSILENMFLAMGATENISITGDMTWVGTQKAIRQSKVLLFRSSSQKVIEHFYGAEEKGKFIELFKFLEPAAVAGFATSSLRKAGELEDKVTHYSPVIEASRELLPANKGDSIINSLFSLDDLFVFSLKKEMIKAKVVAEKTLFLPFSSTSASRVDSKGSFEEKQKLSDGTMASVVWNHEMHAFAQHAPWLPLTMRMIPRDTWIIEVFFNDPFYPSGKQVVVIDKESKLPFYKIVHDRYGEVSKTVFAAWSYLKNKDQANKEMVAVYPSFVVSVDRGARRASTFRSLGVNVYSDEQAVANESLKASFEAFKEEKVK